MTTAIVLGANGQDGSHLCELLAREGRAVVGVGRQPAYRHPAPAGSFRYEPADLGDAAAVDRLLDRHAADQIYHVAAVHGHAGVSLDARFDEACAVNVTALHRALEHARRGGGRCRVFYASSAKVFGPLTGRVTLDTPRAGRCLYGLTKRTAGELAAHYRTAHGIGTTVALLFNHESPRRPPEFFIPKICGMVAAACRDPGFRGRVDTLSFCCDWSSAADLMALAVQAVDRGVDGELLFASGTTLDARPFVRRLFARYGLDAERHVAAGPERPYPRFEVDLSDTVRRLDVRPQQTIFDVCDRIIALAARRMAA